MSATDTTDRIKKKIYVKWPKGMRGNKGEEVFDQLDVIGSCVVCVVNDGRLRHNISASVANYQIKTGKILRINYATAHLVEVEFVGVL